MLLSQIVTALAAPLRPHCDTTARSQRLQTVSMYLLGEGTAKPGAYCVAGRARHWLRPLSRPVHSAILPSWAIAHADWPLQCRPGKSAQRLQILRLLSSTGNCVLLISRHRRLEQGRHDSCSKNGTLCVSWHIDIQSNVYWSMPSAQVMSPFMLTAKDSFRKWKAMPCPQTAGYILCMHRPQAIVHVGQKP